MLLSDLVEDYIQATNANSYAKSTKQMRARVARNFVAVVGNIQVHNLTARHVDAYFAAREKVLKPNSLNLELALLRDFIKYALRVRALRDDPVWHRRAYRMQPPRKRRIPASDFPRLLDAARHPRDRMVVALGLYAGLRQSEIRDLRVGDVDLHNGYVSARIIKSSLADDMPISAELDRELRTWLTWYGLHVGGPLDPNWYLTPAKSGPQLVGGADYRMDAESVRLRPDTPAGHIERLVHAALEGAGYPVIGEDGTRLHEGAHTLRRSAARALFESLADQGHDNALRIVQAFLHHSSQTTTEKYLGVEIDKRKRDDIIKGKTMFPIDTTGVRQFQRKAQ